jgi:hypothetical protein
MTALRSVCPRSTALAWPRLHRPLRGTRRCKRYRESRDSPVKDVHEVAVDLDLEAAPAEGRIRIHRLIVSVVAESGRPSEVCTVAESLGKSQRAVSVNDHEAGAATASGCCSTAWTRTAMSGRARTSSRHWRWSNCTGCSRSSTSTSTSCNVTSGACTRTRGRTQAPMPAQQRARAGRH